MAATSANTGHKPAGGTQVIVRAEIIVCCALFLFALTKKHLYLQTTVLGYRRRKLRKPAGVWPGNVISNAPVPTTKHFRETRTVAFRLGNGRKNVALIFGFSFQNVEAVGAK